LSNLDIRLADLNDEADLAAIVALTSEYAEHSVLGRPLDPEILRQLPAAMRAHGGVRTMLAFSEGKPVGIATCILSFTTFGAGPVLNLHDFAVTRGSQGQGVGSQLLEAVQAMAEELGCVKVTLEVVPENPARRLYARSGFSESAIFCERKP
jgi:GNAT superfamily N-acetyltransferase